ncbi:MAG: sigma factor, partial [Gammaproteobacteria bacterium]
MSKNYVDDERRWSDWMARAQRGDLGDYELLLREIGAAIEIYIRVRFGTIDMLEDCVQECLLAVHAARHTYDPRRLFRPWFFTIVRHKTIDQLRQRRTWSSAMEASAHRPVDSDSD